jgi:hypothetical protein
MRWLGTLAEAQARRTPLPPRPLSNEFSNASCVVGVGVQGALAALQVAETSQTAEATFTGVTHSLSVTACAARVRRDVAQGSATVPG